MELLLSDTAFVTHTFNITYKTLIFLAVWQLFKCGILTLPDHISHTGSPLLHMVSHFTGIVNNI